jgi:hypothetical protein
VPSLIPSRQRKPENGKRRPRLADKRFRPEPGNPGVQWFGDTSLARGEPSDLPAALKGGTPRASAYAAGWSCTSVAGLAFGEEDAWPGDRIVAVGVARLDVDRTTNASRATSTDRIEAGWHEEIVGHGTGECFRRKDSPLCKRPCQIRLCSPR